VDKAKFLELVALAERHVTEAAAIIQHQEQLIKDMRDRGEIPSSLNRYLRGCVPLRVLW